MSTGAPRHARRVTLPHVRLYRSIRSAHLERAHELGPATILYSEKRYDFDGDLVAGLDLVEAGPLRGALLLLRSDVAVLEVNEPLMLDSLPATVCALAALGARRMLGRPRTSVVAYAIGNADPFARATAPRWRTRVRRRIEYMLSHLVWRRLDRVAFGTSAARATYASVLGAPGPRASTALIPALPAPMPARQGLGRTEGRVVFLGAFTERKGIRVLLDAWPAVADARPEASLLVMGKGSLAEEILAVAALHPRVEVRLDPDRDEIHERLDEARVLVLPSQPSPTWREQVGLPIVEGLSHGLSIVTTTETGLADWLGRHGHYVVSDAGSADELAGQIIRALEEDRRPADVTASLPRTDGRLAADSWMFERVAPTPDLAEAFTR